jgi:hypothetical protein
MRWSFDVRAGGALPHGVRGGGRDPFELVDVPFLEAQDKS